MTSEDDSDSEGPGPGPDLVMAMFEAELLTLSYSEHHFLDHLHDIRAFVHMSRCHPCKLPTWLSWDR